MISADSLNFDATKFSPQELDAEESALIEELTTLKEQMEQLNPDEVHRQLLEALEKEALNSISTALDISDLMEDRPNSNSIYHQDVEQLKNNASQRNERRSNYERSKMTGEEFMAGVKRIETEATNLDGSRIHVDCYTGENLVAGDVDDKYDHEHVISAKEISDSYFAGLFMSEEELREFANSDKNLKITRAGINRSKADEDLKSWLKKPHPGSDKTNAEYYNIDPDVAEATYNEAHSELRKKIALKACERATSMAKTTAVNVGGYALKQTIGELLKITIKELIKEFKQKCVDPLKERFKRVIKGIKSQLKNLIKVFEESALNNFVSTLIDAVLNVFVNTTKKIFKIIRMLYKSILKAFKVLFSKDSEISFSDRLLAASKIIGAAMMGVLGVFLDELICSALSSIPGVAVIAPYISPILSALIMGMITALIMQGFSAYQKGKQYVDCKVREGQIIYRLECISESRVNNMTYQTKVIAAETLTVFKGVLTIYSNCLQHINEQLLVSHELHKKITSTQKRTRDNINDIDEILEQCNNVNYGLQ